MTRLITAVGAPIVALFIYIGELVVLAGETFASIIRQKIRWRMFMNQMVEIGLNSQLVVVITGGFTGAVFAAQTFFQFNKLGMGSAVGAVVSVSLFRELGPVLTALMVTGRVGAAMSAEIGTMKVTEQIDALRALAGSPGRLPRRAADIGDDGFHAAACGRVHRRRDRFRLFCRHHFA
jgi:phospholipid/cholesterol/gamma-HCH transport system permease protein